MEELKKTAHNLNGRMKTCVTTQSRSNTDPRPESNLTVKLEIVHLTW